MFVCVFKTVETKERKRDRRRESDIKEKAKFLNLEKKRRIIFCLWQRRPSVLFVVVLCVVVLRADQCSCHHTGILPFSRLA
jgi:hypothetical protein